MPAWYAKDLLVDGLAIERPTVLPWEPLRQEREDAAQRQEPVLPRARPEGASSAPGPHGSGDGGSWQWDWTLWALWLAASIVGGTAGWFLGLAVGRFVGAAINPEGGFFLFFPLAPGQFEAVFLGIAWIGPFMGIGQWLVLQPRLSGAVAWLLLSLIQALVAVLQVLLSALSGWILGGVVLAVGLGQWWVLQQANRQAGWWLLAYGLSWGLALVASDLILGTPAAGAVIGTLFGIITGVALVWILGHRRARGYRGTPASRLQ